MSLGRTLGLSSLGSDLGAEGLAGRFLKPLPLSHQGEAEVAAIFTHGSDLREWLPVPPGQIWAPSFSWGEGTPGPLNSST